METPPNRSNLHVLVVDDDRDAAEALAQWIEQVGYRATTAHDGRDALRQVRDGNFGLVLLDIGLPDMDGYEVARRLTLRGERSMNLVVLSGLGGADDLRRAEGAGFDEYVVKPWTRERLAAILARALARVEGH